MAPLRRLALFLGVLLHLAGAAAVPAFHAWGEAVALPTAGAGAVSHGDGQAPDQPAHDEVSCVLCHASAQVAVPSGGTALPISTEAPGAEPASASFRPASAPAHPANARAPPRLS